MEREFIIFFLNYCLDHYFRSKVEMAREIDVGVSTLMRVMNPPYKFKAGSVPFENMLWYCLKNGIDIVPIFKCFDEKYSKRVMHFGVCELHERPLWLQPCLGITESEVGRKLELRDDAIWSLLRLSQQFGSSFCMQCSRICFYPETTSCLALRTMRRMIFFYEQDPYAVIPIY